MALSLIHISSGIRQGMMMALKMSAERMALYGLDRCMIFSTCICGMAIMNMAGIIAKYFAISLAMEKVVRLPRVMSSCLPISTTSKIFVRCV